MPLTEAQTENLKLWLEQQDTQPSCPSCGKNSWRTSEIVMLSLMEGQPMPPLPQTNLNPFPRTPLEAVVPLVMVVCGQCGYVKFYSARAIGLI